VSKTQIETLTTTIADLTARLDASESRLARLERCPKLMHYVAEHEAAEHARELAIQQDAEAQRARAAEEAALRREVEARPWIRVVFAPDPTPGCTGVEILTDHGKVTGRPGGTLWNMRAFAWQRRIGDDRRLASALANGELIVEAVPVELAVRYERDARRRGE
jgi:hypothetical protein